MSSSDDFFDSLLLGNYCQAKSIATEIFLNREMDEEDEDILLINSLLMICLSSNKFVAVKILLESGADVNFLSDAGSIFHTTIYLIDDKYLGVDELQILQYFMLYVGYSPNFNLVGPNHWTPLHLAVVKNLVRITEILIDNGSDINAQPEIDMMDTPLVLAIEFKSYESALVLLDHGADINRRDFLGRSVLQRYKLKDRTELISKLSSKVIF